MYRLLRNTHLLVGLFFCSFVLVYGLSSIYFGHNSWFPAEATVTETTIAIDPSRALTARALARELMEEHGFRGELFDVKETEDGFRFYLTRIGNENDVTYRRNRGEAHVRTAEANFVGMMIWLHEHSGISYDYAPHNVWGAIVALTSLALLILGGTGIYLWFKLHQERVVGAVLLLGGLGFGLTLIVLLRTA